MERKELLELVRQAREEAPHWDIAEERAEGAARILSDFVNKKIGYREFWQELNSIKTEGLIKVGLEDMRRYPAELGLPPFGYKEIIEHEAKHVKAAASYGLKPETGLEFTRPKNAAQHFPVIVYRAVTLINFPEYMDEGLARKAVIEIAGAPGDDMSETDRLSIKQGLSENYHGRIYFG